MSVDQHLNSQCVVIELMWAGIAIENGSNDLIFPRKTGQEVKHLV
jgi:hypothetical protein